ncbi:MAG: response regulator [Candidatus Aminicenantes bacterium]
MLTSTRDQAFELKTAEHIADSYDLLKKDQIDVFLIDLSVPEINDLESLKKITRQIPDITTLVLTDSVHENEGIEAIKNGIQDYLLKEELSGKTLRHSIFYAIERNRNETGEASSSNCIRNIERYRLSLASG